MLFVDLVGSTAWAESKDPEQVRELLSDYYDLCRRVIDRHGGVVEKFIGDAVVAVWGAPVAREDDAERAVRTALEVVAAVGQYGTDRGVVGLGARAGVVTGEVASWEKASEGLVAGDRVNTAARVQALAEPGCILVDATTKRTSDAAVAYQTAGRHAVKGKTVPLELWQALRVVAGLAGNQRVDGLEASMVGRSRELTMAKELLHATAEGGRAKLVLLSGVAGVGKSRLAWEFEKYVDGLPTQVWWHRGRCLSYGSGVAFWALAEMVRQRFGITEEEPAESAAAKLAEGIVAWVPEPAEREYVEQRLGVLLGTHDAGMPRPELFAGWRLLFQRMAGTGPVVLVVEDLHWADDSFLDFLETLLDWSAGSPIFVLALTRPELYDRRPGWLADRRNATSIHLDPLSPELMGELLTELVPGMPASVSSRIGDRAEGIPLYAVETIRSLIDTDVVMPFEGVYRLVGDVGDLATPQSLNSLLAARLDALAPEQRELVKGLAVLGSSFPRRAVEAVTDADDESVETMLGVLVRREILTVRDDPLSPERGQYAFTQTMLRSVAHDLLTRRERRERHLAVARHLAEAFPNEGEEVSEVIAAHYLDALEADAGDEPNPKLVAQTLHALERAGRRAAEVGAPDAAERQYLAAAEVGHGGDERAGWLEKAGDMAYLAGRTAQALIHYEAALTELRASGASTAQEARLDGRCGTVLGLQGRDSEAIPRMLAALNTLEVAADPVEVARLHSILAIAYYYTGQSEPATWHTERALTLASAWNAHEAFARGGTLKAIMLQSQGRLAEARAMLELAEGAATQHPGALPSSSVAGNLAELDYVRDIPVAESTMVHVVEVSRHIGDRSGELYGMSLQTLLHVDAGRWRDARRTMSQAMGQESDDLFVQAMLRFASALLCALSGEEGDGRSQGALPLEEDVDDVQTKATLRAAVALTGLSSPTAPVVAELRAVVASLVDFQGLLHPVLRQVWPLAVEAALRSGDLTGASELLEVVGSAPPGHPSPYLRAQLARSRALMAMQTPEESDQVERLLRSALDQFVPLGMSYWQARTRLELGEWLLGSAPEDGRSLVAEAQVVFDEVGAGRDSARARAILSGEKVLLGVAPASGERLEPRPAASPSA